MIKINFLKNKQDDSDHTASGGLLPVADFEGLQTVRDCAVRKSSGDRGVVLGVTGPEGCGKTLFLRHAGAILADMGFRVLSVAPMPDSAVEDPRLSLQAWWNLLHQKLPGFPSKLSDAQALRDWGAAHWEHLPPAMRRESLAHCLSEGLVNVSEDDPTVVLIDDMEQFRGLNRQVLVRAFHAARASARPILFVVAASPDALNRWERRGLLMDRVALNGFTQRTFRSYLNACGFPKMGKAFFQALWQATGGLPRYAFHLLALLRESSRSFVFSRGLDNLAGETAADIAVRRLRLLSDTQRSILAVLHFCGRPVMLTFLKRFFELPNPAFKAALQELEGGGWLCREGPWLSLHERFVGHVLLEAFPDCGDVDLRVGKLLESEGLLPTEILSHDHDEALADDEGLVARALEDLIFWGDMEGACELLSRHPERLSTIASDQGRLALLQDIVQDAPIALADGLLTGFDEKDVPGLAMLRGLLAERSGQAAEAAALFAEAAESDGSPKVIKEAAQCGLLRTSSDASEKKQLSQKMYDKGRLGDLASDQLCALTGWLVRQGGCPEARRLLESASRQGGLYHNWLCRALEGRICLQLGFKEEANSLFEEADQFADSGHFRVLKSRSGLLCGEALLLLGRHEEARGLLSASRNDLSGAAPALAVQASLLLGGLCGHDNDMSGLLSSVRCASHDMAVFERGGWPWGDDFSQPRWSFTAAVSQGDQWVAEGDLAAAEKHYLAYLKKSRTRGNRVNAALVLQRMAALASLQGNDSVSLSCIAESLRRARGMVTPVLTAGANLVSGGVSLQVGHYQRAFSSMVAALEGFAVEGHAAGVWEVMTGLSGLFKTLGAYDAAVEAADIGSVIASSLGDSGRHEEAIGLSAWADAAAGRHQQAAEKVAQISTERSVWTQMALDWVEALAAEDTGGMDKVQRVADRSKQLGAHDMAVEAALRVGFLHADNVNLIQGVELIQGILDLALRRRRPELVLRAEAVLGALFLKRGRNKPAREFLRRASENLEHMVSQVPKAFQQRFIAKPAYQAALSFLKQRSNFSDSPSLTVEKLLKTPAEISV